MISNFHDPVLVGEVIRLLITLPEGIYVDGTLGGGGHAEAVLRQIGANGRLIGFDADAEAVEASRLRLSAFAGRVQIYQGNFSDVKSKIQDLGIDKVNGILYDLGVSSRQIDDAARGFSFRFDGPLDMRMNANQSISAYDVVNGYTKEQLAKIFKEYGEEKFAGRIADKITFSRNRKRIDKTGDLAAIVQAAVSGRFLQKSLARIFQSIRIEVNNEMENLRKGLNDGVDLLIAGGRMAVLSYHSLEDRIVKEIFSRESKLLEPSGNKLLPDKKLTPRLKVISKKPIGASEDEIRCNPRSRSAKLRIAEKL